MVVLFLINKKSCIVFEFVFLDILRFKTSFDGIKTVATKKLDWPVDRLVCLICLISNSIDFFLLRCSMMVCFEWGLQLLSKWKMMFMMIAYFCETCLPLILQRIFHLLLLNHRLVIVCCKLSPVLFTRNNRRGWTWIYKIEFA